MAKTTLPPNTPQHKRMALGAAPTPAKFGGKKLKGGGMTAGKNQTTRKSGRGN